MRPLQKTTKARRTNSPDECVRVIVKTKKSDYVPPGVTVRARIDELMFTGETTAERLDELDRDPDVASVSPATKVRQIG